MISIENLNEILTAFDRQISLHGGSRIDLVVCGGTALFALGLAERTTRDVDVLGCYTVQGGIARIDKIGPFPEWFKSAARTVQRDFNLAEDWINTGPENQLETGLPEGFEERLVRKSYGTHFTIYYISRYDQIHFKLYAAIDLGGYHVDDLFNLRPTVSEMRAATKWVLTQDVSDGFRLILKDFLNKKGYHGIAQTL
jgi:Nucleotidyltransferase of unknown function (DUF6036)